MSEKYGFVYLWFDRKHGRFYIGSHWGRTNDGYKCSSNWMRDAFKRRPSDFKRRILKTNIKDRAALLTEEHRWLSMVKDHEIGKRYYNLTKHHPGHWAMMGDDVRKTVGEKIAASPLRRKRIGEAHKGRPRSQEYREKISRTLSGRKSPTASEQMKRQWSDPKYKNRMSEAHKGKPSARKGTISNSRNNDVFKLHNTETGLTVEGTRWSLSEQLGLSLKSIARVQLGHRRSHKGWTIMVP